MNGVYTKALKPAFRRGPVQSRARREQGMALIISLLLLVLLTLLAVTGLRSSLVEEMVSGNQKLAASALFGAEQGVSEALDDLFAGTISDTGSETDLNWSQGGTVSGPGYSAGFTVRHLLAGGSLIEDDDGRRYFLINSTGQTTTGAARRMLEVAVALEWESKSNVAGFIGCQGITGDGNIVTSSYSASGEPSDGDRGDMATTDTEAFLYLDGSSDMDITGEVRSTGGLWLKSDALVRRDALANLLIRVEDGDIWGSAYTNDQYDGSESAVHGDIYENYHIEPLVEGECDPLNIDTIVDGAMGIMGANHNAGLGISPGGDYSAIPAEIGVDGAASDYWFDDVTINNEAVVTVHGDVRMYVTGDFTMDSNPELILAPGASLKIYMESGRFEMNSNSLANIGGMPINLHVYSRAVNTIKDDKDWENGEPDVWDTGDAKVVINSNSVLIGIVYAPRAHVYLDSNVQVSGSVRGRFATVLSNFDFNYDEDLDVVWVGNPTDYKLVYWTEQYPE